MGFVDGGTLADKLRDGPLEPHHAAEIVMQLAAAVAYAHSKQITSGALVGGRLTLLQVGKQSL